MLRYSDEHISFTVNDGEQLAIVGPNASGKTQLARSLAGRNNIGYITFQDTTSAIGGEYYSQQRWNLSTTDFELEGEDRDLITMSSGELRKHQLRKALASMPQAIILDNPYIGLDPTARVMLNRHLSSLVAKGGLSLVLVLARLDEIPAFSTHVLELGPDGTAEKMTMEKFASRHFPKEVVNLHKVSIRYGERTILNELDWIVREGEHWALTGTNGCGKSTLLSLICADNPQAYACDIDLFGRKRGTGETIWDIKRNIGFVSPEMHRAYINENAPAIDIVTSGLFDTEGLFRKPTEEQREACREWMERFGIQHIADRKFRMLSSGEQRLCLVCRAFVKNPPLYILDEPLHGLDNEQRWKVKALINEICSQPGKTLIMVTHYPEEFPGCIDHSLTLTRND